MKRLLSLTMLLLPLAAAHAAADPPDLPQAAIDQQWINPWPDAWERRFRQRAAVAIEHNTGKGNYGNTYFENEKASYPPAMFDVLFDDREKGKAYLQAEDNQAGSWNSQTEGIDFYAAFTLKHQMRKYFLLGRQLGHLDADYLGRMKRGATKWTEEDPMRRQTKYFKGGGHGWTPETKNSWVDVRNTDNLRAMRETSVYLMAEETGHEKLRQAYKEDIQRYAWALWHIGMGEWDSENYHFHTIAPYLNLYDFAEDPEVKRTAKAALDMLLTMAAVKYYRGGWAGPIKRDYNKPYVFAGAAGEAWLYFNDTPAPNPHPHGDMIHMITSAYRPPAAVYALAQKNFDEGVELFAAKPTYETWKAEGDATASKGYPAPNYQQADHEPWVMETTYIGQTFQLGTLPQGSFGDVNGFKLLMADPEHGAQFFTGASVGNPTQVNRGSGKDKIAHYRHAMINLTDRGDAPWAFILPAGAAVEDADGIRFIRQHETWLALRPINLKLNDPDGKRVKGWKHTQAMTGKGTGGEASGFVLEIGEPRTHGSYDKFKQAVRSKAKLEVNGKSATYTTTTGQTVGLELTGAWVPRITRDGKPFNPMARQNWALYRPADGSDAPICLGWKAGKLHVEAGGQTFDATYPDDHAYTWEHGKR